MMGIKSRLLVILLVFIIVFNFCAPVVLADEMSIDWDDPEWAPYKETAEEVEKAMKEAEANGQKLTPSEAVAQVLKANSTLSEKQAEQASDTGTGLFTRITDTVLDVGSVIGGYVIKIVMWLFGKSIYMITQAAGGENETVTIENILFNKLSITSINFFENNNSNTSISSFSEGIKSSIASWYRVMRTIALIASLCVLIYIAIRMATSTMASDKAEYKRMLTDWVVGFALIFVLHYIILLVITGNNIIVQTLYEAMGSSSDSAVINYIDSVETKLLSPDQFTMSFGYAMIYCMLVFAILAFLIMYIKRMIVVAFLIIIAPLITITYSIDKVGDSKSQALDTWLKEFIWTVLIQPFHCVIYVVFVSISVNSLSSGSFSSVILALICMKFIFDAEDIIKKIFGIQANNIGNMKGSMALAMGSIMAAKKLGGSAAGAGKRSSSNVDRENPKGASGSNIPKTKDGGIGVGTSEVKDEKPSFTQGIANKFDSPKVKEAMKGFDNFMENTTAGKSLSLAGKATSTVLKTGYNVGSTMFGVAMAIPTSKGLDDIIAGGTAGYALGKAVERGAKWVCKKGTSDVIEKGRTRNVISNVQKSYNEVKKERNIDDTKMRELAEVLIDAKLDSDTLKNMDEPTRLFAHNLQVLRHQMEKAGEDTSFENVLKRARLKNLEEQENQEV